MSKNVSEWVCLTMHTLQDMMALRSSPASQTMPAPAFSMSATSIFFRGQVIPSWMPCMPSSPRSQPSSTGAALVACVPVPSASSLQDCPDDCTVGYRVEFVWKSTSFDRMRAALTVLDKDRTSISGYLYHTLLGGWGEGLGFRCAGGKHEGGRG